VDARRYRRTCARRFLVLASAVLGVVLTSGDANAQVPLRDLVLVEQDVPWRLVGYGLVIGLDGTGDRTIASHSGGQTVLSVVNLLRRFDVEVPPELLRTRNVAAVLVTAEVSPYLRSGGRFEVQVGSMGDASSLRGGVLWATPLSTGPGQAPVATAGGPVVISDGADGPAAYAVETSARIPGGGLLELALPQPSFADAGMLVLKQPDLGTALLVADAINTAIGAGTAAVEDPGSVRLTLPAGGPEGPAQVMGQIQQLTVSPQRRARVIIDGRDGTVVAGSGLTVGEAVVSHRGITLSVDAADTPPQDVPGMVQVAPGASVQEVAGALHAVGASPAAIATIFSALRDVGAVTAEIVIR